MQLTDDPRAYRAHHPHFAMSIAGKAGHAPQASSILHTLQAAEMVDTKAVLPAEIMAAILDYLPVPDLLRFARTSHRMREMVYDDTRWVTRLKSMGCWDEAEARRRFDEAMQRRRRAAADRTAAAGNLESNESSESNEPNESNSEDSTPNVVKASEYGKLYGALAPFYFDLVRAKTHTDPVVFRVFKDPERQAQMLTNLRVFARSDWSQGWQQREQKLDTMVAIFETAVLREFEQGYEYWDVDGRMKRYATVLDTLNGGLAGIELFIQKHPLFAAPDLGEANPMDCLNLAPADSITLDPSRRFFDMLSRKVNEQADMIARIFPHPDKVYWPLLDRVRSDIVFDYCTAILDETHARSLSSYLEATSGLFKQTLHFFRTLEPPARTMETMSERARALALETFEQHLDLYLTDELSYFVQEAEREVGQWETKLSEQDANRGDEDSKSSVISGRAERNRSWRGWDDNARLEGIRSLFSIEVALNLVHAAKTSLGRAAVFIQLGGQAGGEAKELCESIFVALLRVLSHRHIKPGFDKAVEHLSQYNPREVSNHNHVAGHVGGGTTGGVAPLVTFIELVNVGDLISQMIDVFYEQQLAGPHIADRNDFLNPAGLAKKKFEQMLDESVAAGLNKGIDVLMDEVEYLCATTQRPEDYNPGAANTEASANVVSSEKGTVGAHGGKGQKKHGFGNTDVGPTETARRIRDLVASHTRMLVGSTEKAMLDVFNGEVGHRLFTAVCKHLKRQRVSTVGAVRLIADMNLYFDYVCSLRNPDLVPYFRALRELSQIYLIDARSHAKEMATIIADGDRFAGVFRAEEVYEYAERRADWYQVRKNVERAMYGLECAIM
ncbi:hypothetical protein P8C59_007994 [Phyllachora maydis]|uniref:F-box domain-containing protein n=1 Tax=Phyllachora maydis TaxID=1825666 RepID=A0AAD9MER6_9PEZI|nr:hypothetical protein P8C59_007994 [Phyllachora maydis]